MRNAHLGSNNPNYGKVWITDGVHNKHISPDEELPYGWWRGKVRKKSK